MVNGPLGCIIKKMLPLSLDGWLVQVEVEVGGWDWRMETTIITIIKPPTGSFIVIINVVVVVVIIIFIIIIPFTRIRMDYLTLNHSSYLLKIRTIRLWRTATPAARCHIILLAVAEALRSFAIIQGQTNTWMPTFEKERSGRNPRCFQRSTIEKSGGKNQSPSIFKLPLLL